MRATKTTTTICRVFLFAPYDANDGGCQHSHVGRRGEHPRHGEGPARGKWQPIEVLNSDESFARIAGILHIINESSRRRVFPELQTSAASTAINLARGGNQGGLVGNRCREVSDVGRRSISRYAYHNLRDSFVCLLHLRTVVHVPHK